MAVDIVWGYLRKGDTMTQQGQIIIDIKQAIREPYAWPGGYPLYVDMYDGGCLCVACGKEELYRIATATAQKFSDGWRAAGVCINWEDTTLICDHCAVAIDSAYGEEGAR